MIECFVSYAEMAADAIEWARSEAFDGVAAVIGVPRSGVVPASIVGLHRNIHVLRLEALKRPIVVSPIRRGGRKLPPGPVMVMEDTVRSGRTIADLRAKLGRATRCGRPIIYGSLYAREESRQSVDRFHRLIPRRSVFQWNWQHVKSMQHTMIDMDGVLYPDEAEADEDARPLFVPTYTPRAVVTGRGEHLAAYTRAWLGKHGIKCPLHMMPSDPEKREALGGPAGFKATIYAADDEAQLFVESDKTQARTIAGLAKKPVLCTQTWKLYR